jgi:hypothetical protein
VSPTSDDNLPPVSSPLPEFSGTNTYDSNLQIQDSNFIPGTLETVPSSRLQSPIGDNVLADQQNEVTIVSLQQIKEIQPDNWTTLSETEKLSTLNEVEDIMAGIQGRPALPIMINRNASPGEFGYFDKESNQIFVGAYSLENDSVMENVDTIVHEGRHAYQWHAVNNPGFHPDPNEVAAWQDNFLPANYLTATEYGQQMYISQPVEADAWSYGSIITEGVFGEKK